MRASSRVGPASGVPVQCPHARQVDDFVERGRRLAESHGLDFDSVQWEVGDLLGPVLGRPRHGIGVNLLFTDEAGHGKHAQRLHPSMEGFAKAYVAHELCYVQLSALRARIDACRLVGRELGRRKLDSVARCTIGVFNACMTDLADRCSASVLFAIGVQLEMLARFLVDSGLTSAPLRGWSCGVEPPRPLAGTSGAEFDENAEARLPPPGFMTGVAEAFARADDELDVYVSSSCAVLTAVPGRMVELLNLQEDCLIERSCKDLHRVGLRWPGSKGDDWSMRWVMASMTEVAREAITRLHAVSAEARRIKRWYDRHPAELYLPPALEHLRTSTSLSEADAAALFGVGVSSLKRVRRREGLSRVRRGPRGSWAIPLREVEASLLSRVPVAMRSAGGPRYRPLMLARWQAFRGDAGGSPCLFETIDASTIRKSLNPGAGRLSLFQRTGVDPEGTIKGTVHSIRHWHTTNASRGGLSLENQAAWFGRGSLRWVSRYDHVSNEAIRGAVECMPAAILGRYPTTGGFRGA